MRTDQKTKEQGVHFLEWMGHRGTRVILLKIWSAGALILTKAKPILGQPMWIRLEGPVRFDWLRAIPVRYGKSHEVELRFSQPASPFFRPYRKHRTACTEIALSSGNFTNI